MLSRFAILATAIGHARARYLLVTGGLVIGVVLAAATAWIVIDLRSDRLSHAQQDLRNLALMLSEELDRGLQGMDLLQLSLIERMRERGIDTPEAFDQLMRSPEVHEDLARRISRLSEIAALSLHDPTAS